MEALLLALAKSYNILEDSYDLSTHLFFDDILP